MNNFFLDSSDYSLFLKAMKRTKNEPVVINVLSTDESLVSNSKKEEIGASQRKSMSKKFEPSPFGKFFGPRKQNVAVDMKDFSSWKNKNYRKVEQSLGQTKDIDTNFSMSQFMTEKATEGKFNPVDQLKTETNKSIDQLSTDDPLYKRFSLDSYMAKLEQQSAVKDEFEVNDDILEPLGADTQQIIPDSSQDENFNSNSGLNVEKLAFDEHLAGETFSFEREELDKVKTRLEKIEKEAKNISDKPKDKVITSEDMSELKGEEKKEDDFGGLLDEEDLEITESLGDSNEPTKLEEVPKVKGKKFIQINKIGSKKAKESTNGTDDEFLDSEDNGFDSTPEALEVSERDSNLDDNASEVNTDDTNESLEDLGEDFDFDKSDEVSESDDEDDKSVSIDEVVETGDELDSDEDFVYIDEDEPQSSIKKTRLKRSDILTKDDVRSITDEFMAKFAEMNKKETPEQTQPYGYSQHVVDPYDSDDLVDVNDYNQESGEDTELKSKIQELIDSNKRNDEEMAEKLEMAERQKAIVAEEYESRIKEMEESFKKHYDDVRKKAYLEKLDSDIKLQEAEMKFKKKADDIKEQEKISSQKDYAGAILKRELKSNINISNLEVDKKLLEIASLKNKQHLYKVQETEDEAEEVKKTKKKTTKKKTTTNKTSSTKKATSKSSSSTKKKTSTKTTQAKKKTTRRKSTTTTRRPSTRRKIDSDIIGGIKFD